MSRMLAAYLSVGLFLSLPAGANVRTITYSYTPGGLVQSINGSREDVADITTFSYDASGNRSTMTNALGHVTRYTDYDAAGRLLRMVDPNGLETRFTYHPRGWLWSHSVGSEGATATTTFEYDVAGNPTRITLPYGGHLNFAYDGANRLIAITDDRGNRRTYTLDGMGNRIAEETLDASNIVTHHLGRVYDMLNRLQKILGATTGRNTTVDYDPAGNIIGVGDGLERTTASTYDALNRLTAEIDANGDNTRFAHDPRDNLIRVVDPRGNTTTYDYNTFDEKTRQISPDTGESSFSYDAAGNVRSITDARGITTSYSYDALNRLTTVRFPDDSLDVSYFYDEGSHGIGRLTRMVDPHGTTTYEYDQRGNLIRETRRTGDIELITAYTYDHLGQLVSLTYPSGYKVHYGYDTQGRTTGASLEDPDGGTRKLIDNLTYLPFGPKATAEFGNGLQLARMYDQDYRLTEQRVSGVIDAAYDVDPVDNIVAWRDLLDANRDQAFEYDDLDRLLSAEGPYGDIAYAYDALGNRLSFHTDLAADSYVYANDSNRLQEIISSSAAAFAYDAAGNTTSSAKGDFVYDESGRLSGYSTPGFNAIYAYDGVGKRVIKTVNGSTTHFLYIGSQLLGEYDESGTMVREHVYLNEQPIAMLQIPADEPASYSVLQKVTTSHRWTTVDLGGFDQAPVIIAGPPTTEGKQAAVVGLRNITASQVEVAIREWNYLDGSHYMEDLSMLAMPPGRYRQSDGSIWEFGRTIASGTKKWHAVAFDAPFEHPPAVFVTVQTTNDADTVVARVRGVTRSSFNVALFEEEQRQNGHPAETIGYLAVYTPAPSDSGSVSLQGAVIDYQLANSRLDERPAVIAGATLVLQEEQSKDSETNHLLEQVAVLQLGGFMFAQDVTTQGIDTAAIRLNSTLPDTTYHGGTNSSGSNLYYVHTDHLGAPIRLTDENGSLAWDANRLPFGDLDILTTEVEMPLRFPGQYFDAESGLYYNYFRDYDPSTGRYIQSDPIGLAGGLNTYAYVGGNPLVHIDPTGEAAILAMIPAMLGSGGSTSAAVGGGFLGLGLLGAWTAHNQGANDWPDDSPSNSQEQCDDDDPCDKKLDKRLLKSAGLRGGEHDAKAGILGTRKNLSKYDVCGCKDGRVVVRRHGCKGPNIGELWGVKWK